MKASESGGVRSRTVEMPDGRVVRIECSFVEVTDGAYVIGLHLASRTLYVDDVPVVDPARCEAIAAEVKAHLATLTQPPEDPTMTDTARPLDLLGEDAMQLGHTINMVADLPRYLLEGTTAHGPELHAHVRHAIAESFAINAALLAQFIDEQIDPKLSVEERLFLMLDQVPLPEPLATWRADARHTAEYIGLDVLGEWKP